MTPKSIALILIVASRALGLPEQLSATGLYRQIAEKTLEKNVESYTPQYPLWSDGAAKERWILLPENGVIDTSKPDHWVFPVGTKLWKEFSLAGKRIETRLLEKTGEDDWEMGSYLWNETETEAKLAPEEGIPNYIPSSPTTSFDIPSQTECRRCHKHAGDPVLGFDGLQLSTDRDPLAPHAEKTKPHSLDLKRLISENRISHNASEFAGGASRIHASNETARATLGYLHANCGSCHNPRGNFPHIKMDLRHLLKTPSETAAPAYISTVDKPTLVVNFPGQEITYRVRKGLPDESALYRLMIESTTHMPPLGADIQDKVGIELIKKWISGMQ